MQPKFVESILSPHTYLSVHRQGVDTVQEIFGAIARFDHQSNSLTVAVMGENRYPMEPIYALNPQNPDIGWVVTVVYDGNTEKSEVWVFDSDHLDEPPVCRLGLPSVVPMGFHVPWKPA